MSSQLDENEVIAESPVHDGTDKTVSVSFTISAEAIDMLVKRGITGRSLQQSQTVLLACGIYTLLAELRDKQHAIPLLSPEEERKDVPRARRRAQLRAAGRCAALAITSLEDAILWAAQARDHAL